MLPLGGWTLLGPDPAGNPNYRSYKHDGCGHTQRDRDRQHHHRPASDASNAAHAGPQHRARSIFSRLKCQRKGISSSLAIPRDPESRLRYQLGHSGFCFCQSPVSVVSVTNYPFFGLAEPKVRMIGLSSPLKIRREEWRQWISGASRLGSRPMAGKSGRSR